MTALSFVWVHPYSKNSRCDNIITPEYSYCKSPQYTADECDEDIQNQIEDETQSDLNEDTVQESQIPEYNESLLK